MEDHKQAKKSKGLSAQEKSDLRVLLSDSLESAHLNPDAAKAALRASLDLRLKVPVVLLTRQNLASTLSLREISASLERLSVSGAVWDLSAGLYALQDLAKQRQPDSKALLSIAKAVTTKLTKMVTPPVRKPKGALPAIKKDEPVIVFTGRTLASSTDLALWLLPRLFEHQSSSRRSGYRVALRLVQMVEIIWQRSLPRPSSLPIISFLRSLANVLPKADYSDFEDEPTIVAFSAAANAALIQEAEIALLEGRLKELDSILTFAKRDGKRGDILLSHLRSICRNRPSEVVPEAVEWIARQTERENPKIKTPTAADESQASTLNYVVVCLLAAWDAAAEGSKAARALESTQRLARDLFKVDLAGRPGQIVDYEEQQHELSSPVKPAPTRVRLIRPGVLWSDGIRTRFLVRAIVEPAS
ncbi:MAG: hypothetical protein H7Z16_01680 [Pyrinomonadaceae bacterium]|nr:hypothetical protein [Pyrinomonadaceae bacterium]